MATDVRRWGGYCPRTSSSAALTLGALGATVSTSARWPVAIMAIRRPVDTADIWPAQPSAWACQAFVPARRYRKPAALPPPPPLPPCHPGGPRHPQPPPLSVPVALPGPRGLARRPQVALQDFHPSDQAVSLLGDVRQPRLGGPLVLVGPGQAGLEVAGGGLRADRTRLPRPRPLQLLHPLVHRPPSAPAFPPAPPAPPGWSYGGTFGGGGGGGARCPLGGAAFPLPGRGGGVVPPLDVNDVSPPHLPLSPHMDAHGKPCHMHPLRLPLLPPRDHIQPKDPSRGHRPLLPNPRQPRLHPPVPAHKPVGKHAYELVLLGQVGIPMTTMGQGKEMRRVPCTPRDSKTMSHTAERCRCRPSGPGGTFCVQAGSGCLGARVTRSWGGLGVGGAQVFAGRHGDDHLARRMPRTGAGLAMASCRASGAPRTLTAPTAGLAWGPSTTGASGRLAVRLGVSGPGFELAPGAVPDVRRPRVERDLQTGRRVQGTNGEWGSKHGTMQ